MMRRIIVSADDFGLTSTVNEAVRDAHRNGILSTCSLMVAAPAAAEAVAMAQATPSLRVGLHLVLVEGDAVLPHARIPALVDQQGRFGSDQVRRGFTYFFSPSARRQLAEEIDAQFAAFRATGLTLDHANAHKHMHLHPTVGKLLCEIGRDYGLRAIRIPAEPPAIMAACGEKTGLSDTLLYRWTGMLRAQARKAGLSVNDHVFGLRWSGHMTSDKLLRLSRHLPSGVTEIYTHPASRPDATLRALMPEYDQTGEYAALTDPQVRDAFTGRQVQFIGWNDL
ncbi:cellobiose phosphotransferase system celC [Granulibacter bethesdensis]|nr:cellobiose phosphotransferase system celC [Granulibacter bethesdensis]